MSTSSLKPFVFVATLLAAVTLTPQAAMGQPVVADGYKLKQNCPNIVLDGLGGIFPGQMALGSHGRKMYLVYTTPGPAGPGEVHVRDLYRCTQRLLIPDLNGPLGIAVHPWTKELYISHRYINEKWLTGEETEEYQKYRSAVSIYDPHTGQQLVKEWVRGFAPIKIDGDPGAGNLGTGIHGLTFDRAGNLWMSTNVNVFETESRPPDFYALSTLYKVDRIGAISVFATGIRASFEAAIAKTNHHGEAIAFYAGDNGEGTECVAEGCEGREGASRQYYDELNYLLEGKHYGYPESAPDEPWNPTKNVTHNGALWNFDRAFNGAFPAWPVPTGIAIAHGKWGKVRDPLFLMFWFGSRLDMFTGPNRSNRTTLVSGLAGFGIDVVVRRHDKKLFIQEWRTRNIYSLQPSRHHWH